MNHAKHACDTQNLYAGNNNRNQKVAVNADTPLPPIYVINLKRSTDRREAFIERAQQLDIQPQFLEAVDGSRLHEYPCIRYSRWRRRVKFGYHLSNGAIGLTASHYKAWQIVADTGSNWGIICEDDIHLNDGFSQDAKDVIACAEEYKLDFIRLHGIYNKKHDRLVAVNPRHTLVRYHGNPMGAQCYLLSPNGARKLLAHARHWDNITDKYFDYGWVHGLQPYGIEPALMKRGRGAANTTLGEKRNHKPFPFRVTREFYRLYLKLARKLYNLWWASLVKPKKFGKAG